MYDLPESLKLLPATRISDIKLFNEIIQPISMSLPPNPKLFRMDHANSGKPQPLKVVFPTKELANSFISNFNTNRRSSESGNNRIAIHISRDCTFLERQEIRCVYTELNNRRKQSEYITIRYRNGVLHIIQKKKGIGDAIHFSFVFFTVKKLNRLECPMDIAHSSLLNTNIHG